MKLAFFVCLSLLFLAPKADASEVQQWNFAASTNCKLGEWGEEGALTLQNQKGMVAGRDFELSYSRTPTGVQIALGGGIRSMASAHRLYLEADTLEQKTRSDQKEFLVMSGRLVDIAGLRNETNARSVTCYQALNP
jgi:hypothetical protein